MRLANLFAKDFFFVLGSFFFFWSVVIFPLTIFGSDLDSGKKRAKNFCVSILVSLLSFIESLCSFDLAGLSGEKHDWLFIQVLFTLGLILLSLKYLWNSGRIYFDLNKTKDEVYEYVSGCKQLIVKQVIVLVLSLFFFGRMVLILSGKSFPF